MLAYKIKEDGDENEHLERLRELLGIKKKEKIKEDFSYNKEDENDQLKRLRELIVTKVNPNTDYSNSDIKKKYLRKENFEGNPPKRNDGNTVIPNSDDKKSKHFKC